MSEDRVIARRNELFRKLLEETGITDDMRPRAAAAADVVDAHKVFLDARANAFDRVGQLMHEFAAYSGNMLTGSFQRNASQVAVDELGYAFDDRNIRHKYAASRTRKREAEAQSLMYADVKGYVANFIEAGISKVEANSCENLMRGVYAAAKNKQQLEGLRRWKDTMESKREAMVRASVIAENILQPQYPANRFVQPQRNPVSSSVPLSPREPLSSSIPAADEIKVSAPQDQFSLAPGFSLGAPPKPRGKGRPRSHANDDSSMPELDNMTLRSGPPNA